MTYRFTVANTQDEVEAPTGYHLCYAELIGPTQLWALIWEENEPTEEDTGYV